MEYKQQSYLDFLRPDNRDKIRNDLRWHMSEHRTKIIETAHRIGIFPIILQEFLDNPNRMSFEYMAKITNFVERVE